MTYLPMPSDLIDMELAEVCDLVDILLLIAETDERDERERLRSCAVTVLYVVADKLKSAKRETARCPCRLSQPCERAT